MTAANHSYCGSLLPSAPLLQLLSNPPTESSQDILRNEVLILEASLCLARGPGKDFGCPWPIPAFR